MASAWATAVLFHLLATWLFYLFARRIFARDREVLLSTLFFIVVPESTFFGRMMNHEVLVLPAVILLVRGYWECIRGGWSTPRWVAAVAAGTIWAALSGWAGFFAVLALLNEIVWRNVSTDVWVSFKVFGLLPLTFLFAALQVGLLQKHMKGTD